MSPPITRTQKEIDDVLNKAADGMDDGSKWPGMSYEQGVDAAIRWLTGESEDNPMDEG